MTENADFLQAARSYPLPTFPAGAQEHVLYSLTNKTLMADVQKWEADTEKDARNTLAAGALSGQLDGESLTDLWGWVPLATSDIFRKVLANAAVAGEDDDEDEEAEEGTQTTLKKRKRIAAPEEPPMLDLAQLLPFTVTGAFPIGHQHPTVARPG
jgi:hypothetical protein